MSERPDLYILRHGETVWNAEGRMQGALNAPLTAKGEMQAARQLEILRSRDLTGFQALCSPQGRAVQTAGIAVAPLMARIMTDDRLCEITLGDWSGLLRRDMPVPMDDANMLAIYDAAPGGEGLDRLRDRCMAFLADVTGPAVLITHGITSRMLRSLVTDDPAITPETAGGGQGCVYYLSRGQQKLLT